MLRVSLIGHIWLSLCATYCFGLKRKPASGLSGRKLAQFGTSSTAAAPAYANLELYDVLQIYRASTEGGFLLAGSVTLLGNRFTGQLFAQQPDIGAALTTTLPSSTVLASALFEGTACVTVDAGSTGANISGLLSPWANLTAAAVSSTAFDLNAVMPVTGSNFNDLNQARLLVQTDPAETYMYVFYTTPSSKDDLLNPNDPDANITLGLQIHPVGSPVCTGGSSLGQNVASAPQSYAYTSASPTSAYFTSSYALVPGAIQPLRRVITGATCFKYNLLAQKPGQSYEGLDISVLVTNQTGADLLLAEGGEVQADDVWLPQSLCQQNSSSWGQCTASLTDLDSQETYWMWFLSGLQNGPDGLVSLADATVEYTASSSDVCSTLTLPSHSLIQAPSAMMSAPRQSTSLPATTAAAIAPVQSTSSSSSPATSSSPPPTAIAGRPPPRPVADPPTGLLGSFSVSG